MKVAIFIITLLTALWAADEGVRMEPTKMMAVTNTVVQELDTDVIPSSYSTPSDPGLSSPNIEYSTFSVAVSGVADASSAATGFDNLIAEIDTFVRDSFLPDIAKVDTSLTINSTTYILSVTRAEDICDLSDTTIWKTATEYYKCRLKIAWN